MPTDSGTYPSESSDIDDDSTEEETEGSEDDMDALMNMASAQPSQVSVFVPKPGQSLGLSLAPHPEGTYVHSTTSTDKEKMATVGKVATAIVPSGNRGAHPRAAVLFSHLDLPVMQVRATNSQDSVPVT